MVIDRSASGLATAKDFEKSFPAMRQSMVKWHQTGFEYLIFGVISVSNETTMIWARDLDEFAHKAVPALMLELGERRSLPVLPSWWRRTPMPR
jgi:hypothetical protein